MTTIRLSGTFERDDTPARIEYWYDRNLRLWVAQKVNADGYEIGDGRCEYYNSEKVLKDTEKRFNPELPLKKLRAASR